MPFIKRDCDLAAIPPKISAPIIRIKTLLKHALHKKGLRLVHPLSLTHISTYFEATRLKHALLKKGLRLFITYETFLIYIPFVLKHALLKKGLRQLLDLRLVAFEFLHR